MRYGLIWTGNESACEETLDFPFIASLRMVIKEKTTGLGGFELKVAIVYDFGKVMELYSQDFTTMEKAKESCEQSLSKWMKEFFGGR